MEIDELCLKNETKRKVTEKLKSENIELAQYLSVLILKDINSEVDLGNGFYYDRYLDKFFDSDKEILFTKIQKNLLLSLLSNKGEILSVEQLISESWDRKDVSIYTFRNMINQVRKKTYYGLIRNYSNKGYTLNVL